MAGPFRRGLALMGLAMIQFVAGRPSVDELRTPLYKGVKCAACMAVCNETKHILEDLEDKFQLSTKSTEKFGYMKYDSGFHSKLVDKLEKLCKIGSYFDRESEISRKYQLTERGVNLLAAAFENADKEAGVFLQKGEDDDDDDDDDDEGFSLQAMKIDRGPTNKVIDGIGLLTADPALYWLKKETHHDTDWRHYTQVQLSSICAIVTESDEFEEMLEAKSWKKWTPKKQRKVCEELKICPKLMKQHKGHLEL